MQSVKRAGLVKQLFTAASELAEVETARGKWLMFQSRLDRVGEQPWQRFGRLCGDWERQIDRVEEDMHEARDAAVRNTAEAAERVHPLRRRATTTQTRTMTWRRVQSTKKC